ncbi:hypothetical protein [Luteolibacter sp. Populi]|uniref:hypothetical protein n=1 Tax=Luteolibacter sp. Populi TaxID=3230487 RepID=UPI003466C7DD
MKRIALVFSIFALHARGAHLHLRQRIALVFSIFALPLFAQDEEKEEAGLFGKEAPPLAEVLASLRPDETPPEPVTWTSPQGAIVLHGNLLGDGRHLAVVGTNATSFAVGDKSGWKLLSRLEVEPAWVPADKAPGEVGYFRWNPPQQPFTLKDLSGDDIPEVLVVIDNGHSLSEYAIAAKKGDGFELLAVRSKDVEPEIRSGLMAAVTETSGHKSWWRGTTFYRWENGVPRETAAFICDGTDPEISRHILVRYAADKPPRAYELKWADGVCILRRGHWQSGVTMADLEDFATVKVSTNPDADDLAALSAGYALLFERITGLPGWICLEAPYNRENYKPLLADLKLVVEGSPEAKALLEKRTGPTR